MSALREALAALEARSGLGALGRALVGRRLAGGARWTRALGAALLGLLLLQLASGVGLALHYAPTTTSAWASVDHLERAVPGGELVRALHAWGASFLVALAGLHLVGAGASAAYRRPRELSWALGLLLLPLLLAFGLTGYLLPWDQRGYWATTVALGIARATPLVGESAARVLQGGPELSSLTLTRFYALHALVLPGGLLALLALHLRANARAHAALLAEGAPGAPWWPGQALRDLLLLAVALLGVVGLALALGAALEAPADPGSDFPPRPEWWFMPLRELLKVVPEPWGSVVLPGLLGCAWLLLPWLDPPTRPRPRLRAVLVLIPALGYLLLGLRAVLLDRADPEYALARARADEDAALARELARQGVPPEGAGALLEHHPPRRGERLFQLHCQECHPLRGEGGQEGPDLTGYLSRAWLMDVIRAPRDPRFFGHTALDGMDPLPRAEWEQLPALAAFLESQQSPAQAARLDPALVAKGEEAYLELECFACHPIDPGEEGEAPNLHGYGSEEWLTAFLKDPGGARFYGEMNDMPGYAEDLSAEDIAALVTFLRGLKDE